MVGVVGVVEVAVVARTVVVVRADTKDLRDGGYPETLAVSEKAMWLEDPGQGC